jgi:predicted  nucleic acid-binding Zn-ribbon protein
VKEILALLVRLQLLDDRIRDQRRRLDSIPSELDERESLFTALEAAAEQLEAERKARLIRVNELENDVTSDEERITKLEDQLLRTRDAGSIRIGQHEIDGLREKVSTAQEEALGLLDETEALETQRDTAREEVEERRIELAQFRKIVVADTEELGGVLTGFETEREGLMKPLSGKPSLVYEKVASRSGKAIVQLRGGACAGCGMSLNPNDQLKVKAAKALFQCRSCSRILVEQELWAEVAPA